MGHAMKRLKGIFVYTAVLCLISSGFSAGLHAQEISSEAAEILAGEPRKMSLPDEDVPQYPLRPPGTSSPRVTLCTFLTNVEQFIEDWRRNDQHAMNSWAYFRAMETLDLSATPHNSSWAVKTERLLLLKEILDRLELPRDTEIPGDLEVADGAMTQWTIPDTRLTISRIKDGPRAGEFLFSADSIQRLGAFYRQVQRLPYKARATMNVYEDYRNLMHSGLESRLHGQARDRLRGVDTSNPRATLEGFLYGVNRAYELAQQAEAALTATPPTITKAQAREIETQAHHFLRRARATLDLSQVPETLRGPVSTEAALQLKEILDRVPLPLLDAVPDALIVEAVRKERRDGESRSSEAFRWTYPDTEIEIVEIMEGERQGQFLFSAATVSRLNDMYDKARDLPYRTDDTGLVAKAYLYPGTSPGFYSEYIATPGYLVPHIHFLSGILDHLPDWLNMLHSGQTIWQWIALLVCILAVALAAYVIFLAIGRLAGRLRSPWQYWPGILAPAIVAMILRTAIHFVDYDLKITGRVIAIVETGGHAIATALLAWMVLRLSKAIAETIIASPKIDPEGIQASYIRSLFGLAGFLGLAAIVVDGLSRLGVSLIPLLTGLGIGGLALALAARPTIANIIGSFMIFADNPYRVGQRIKVMKQDGIVETIGLRSTKIRLLTGHLTSIPNEKMASLEIENIGQRPYIRRLFNMTIPYDLPPEKISRSLEILREILAVPNAPDPQPIEPTGEPANSAATEDNAKPHPNTAINQPDFPPRVYFNDFNADSLNILVIYWYHPPEYWEYLEHTTWINLQIVERFNAEGIDFAFPTQTVHLAGDDKRALTVGHREIRPSSS